MKNIKKLILNLKCSGSDDKYEIGCILECMAGRIEELEKLIEELINKDAKHGIRSRESV